MGVNQTAPSASLAMPVSSEILPVLAIFLNAFTAPTWEKDSLLLREPSSYAADALSTAGSIPFDLGVSSDLILLANSGR
jgi:hypothetical protein